MYDNEITQLKDFEIIINNNKQQIYKNKEKINELKKNIQINENIIDINENIQKMKNDINNLSNKVNIIEQKINVQIIKNGKLNETKSCCYICINIFFASLFGHWV